MTFYAQAPHILQLEAALYDSALCVLGVLLLLYFDTQELFCVQTDL